MHRLLQSYLDELVAAGNDKQLFQSLTNIALGLGLNLFAYIAIPSAADRHVRLITNYADHWREHYLEQRYETCDPIVQRSIRNSLPFEWGPEFSDDSAFARNFFHEAASFGITFGYTVPINHWHGRFAALTFAIGETQAEFLRMVA